jgi:DNA ligase-1
MKHFAALFNAIDQSTKTTVKVAALAEYFSTADEMDRLWTIALFSGRRPKRAVTTTKLREWASEASGIPLWLFEDSYSIVGDLAETIALVLPPQPTVDNQTLTHWINALRGLADVDETERKAFVLAAWQRLGGAERFLFNKLITGGFRVGVSQKLMTRALARATGKPEAELAHRLMGNWHPDDVTWHKMIEADDASADASRPYPFYLAYGLEDGPDALGDPADWRAEWKWDGIRGQLILRDGEYYVWSRGEELMTDRFPELSRAIDHLPPGTVLDGELLVWQPDAPKPSSFNTLQTRIGRKKVPKKLLIEAPVVLHAYDLLEWQGVDVRDKPFAERRAILEEACANLPPDAPMKLSPQHQFTKWSELADLRRAARDAHAEG